MYTFKVKDASEVDFQRVCRENPNEDAILVGNKESTSFVLLLNTSFLERFSVSDKIHVAGENLWRMWGNRCGLIARNEIHQLTFGNNHSGDSLPAFRYSLFIRPDQIVYVKAQLAVARAFTPRKTVTVEVL